MYVSGKFMIYTNKKIGLNTVLDMSYYDYILYVWYFS